MRFTSRHQALLSYAQSRGPSYVLGFGGAIVCGLAGVAIGLDRQWYALIPLSLILLLVAGYFLAASLWAADRVYGNEEVINQLFRMGRIKPIQDLAVIDLGLRRHAVTVARRLSTGHVTAIDLYNPQLTPSKNLARARNQSARPTADPRLSWQDGNLALLPFPDGSLPAVLLIEVVSEFWQAGDRARLLGETRRIVSPGGRVLLVERIRTPTAILTAGPAALRLPAPDEWSVLVRDAGLQIQEQKVMHDLVLCLCAVRPATIDHQLRLNL
jgi:SAM-dependent methyltransferase